MKQLLILLICLLAYPIFMNGQRQIKGVVRDNETHEPLAFVHIISESGRGTTTDIDGKFSMNLSTNDHLLQLSYVGFESLKYPLEAVQSNYVIYLSPKTFELSEVEVHPGNNPAHRIINEVIAHRDDNNPEKLPAFSYTSYDKLNVYVDEDAYLKNDSALLDSTEIRARAFLAKQDLFIMETVTERKYMFPSLNQENVLATRVSGLKDPVMAFMISQIQSTSFYDERIQIAGSNYINPISNGSTKKYFFLIEDTLYTETLDTVFVISFRPMKNTKFDGLAGFLSINSKGWAIQNVKAEPLNDTTAIIVKIQQSYEYMQDHWFPVQLNTDIIFTNMQLAVGKENLKLVGKGHSYLRDINLNPSLRKSDFGFHEVEIAQDASRKKGEFWSEYRIDSLTERELETYRLIDSIGKAEHFDRMASGIQTLLIGKLPLRIVDVDLDKVIHYNDYEGLYLGVGIHSNERLSRILTLGGYWGYGFSDKRAKYGLDLDLKLHKASESAIHMELYDKVTGSGSVTFFDDRSQIWKTDYFYQFFVNRMNPVRGGSIEVGFRLKPMRDFRWNVGYRRTDKVAFENYFFSDVSDPAALPQTKYQFSDLFFGFRFAFRERIFQTTKGQLSMGSDYPAIWLNYTRGVDVLAENPYTYNRLDLKIEDEIYIKYLGNFSYKIMAGYIDASLPINSLYNATGTYRPITLYAPNSFATMRTNEFFSDRYLSIFMCHNFGNLLFSIRKFKPELCLLTNVAFGSLSNPTNHHNITFSTLEKGYYESGILIRKLLDFQVYDLGLGVLYRYGPYGFDHAPDNLAFKLSLFYGF